MQWKTRKLANTIPTAKKILPEQGHQHRAERTFPQRLCCAMWEVEKGGDRLIVIMDATEHTMDRKLRKRLETEGVGLIELSHKSLGAVPPPHISTEQSP